MLAKTTKYFIMRSSSLVLIVLSIIVLVIYVAINNEKPNRQTVEVPKSKKYTTGAGKVLIEHVVTDVEFEEIIDA